MGALNPKLKKLQASNEANLLQKGERRIGKFKFVKTNGNGTHQWELIDIDKDFANLHNIVTSVTDQENDYLSKSGGVSEIYLSRSPRIDLITNLPEMFEGQPVYGLRLDNPVSNMINSLVNEGLNRSDLTPAAQLKREFLMNNPVAAQALKFKAEFGLTGNRQRQQSQGVTFSSLKSETAAPKSTPAATEGVK